MEGIKKCLRKGHIYFFYQDGDFVDPNVGSTIGSAILMSVITT